MRIRSREGQGTIVSVRLPVSQPTDDGIKLSA